VKFSIIRPWIGAKFYMLLKEVFGFDPLVFRLDLPGYRGWGGDCLVTGDAETIKRALQQNSDLARHIESIAVPVDPQTFNAEPPSDDWPYLYVQNRSIPATYLWIMLILTAIGLLCWFRFRSSLIEKIDWHFFFLGAAFLLVEFQSIHRLSLFLGNTWIVTGVVISAIFIMILLANLVAPRILNVPVVVLYLLLFLAILGTYFFPYHSLLTLSFLTGGILAGLIQALPIFFSGLIFARSFKSSKDLGSALGSNLAGSFAGGMLEAGTFLVGIRALGLVALALYAASWLSHSRR
jgi:hypothetical protein